MESILFYIIKKQTITEEAFFISKPFNMTRKPAFAHYAHFAKHEKSHSRNLLSIQMKQSHWLLCVAQEF